ncbi:hypothetical protein CNMCM8812_008035 [Aspergillus fumigatus]|nr:hypothetical protein CNMCM8812_008035 [Aspergillus fumigatus]
MANRTLESFYKPIRKPGKPRVEDTPPPSYSHHPSYPFPIADLPPSIANTLLDLPATPPRSITNQPHLDLLYYQPFIPTPSAAARPPPRSPPRASPPSLASTIPPSSPIRPVTLALPLV